MRVVLCQMKNGLPSFLALSMSARWCRRRALRQRSPCHTWLEALLPVLHVRHVGEGRQRAFVLDLLFPDHTPARHHGGVIRVSCPAMGQIARAGLVDPVLRIIEPVRDRTWRRGDRDSRRIRRSRVRTADICSGRRGGSCRTGRFHSPAASEPVAMVAA